MGARFRRAAMCCACLLLNPNQPLARAAVVACTGPNGQLTYTQFDCPAGTEQAVADGGRGELSIVRTAPLSDAERAALDRLSRTLTRDRARWAKNRRQAASRRSAERAEARARCEAARRALASLAESRRQGYSATDDRRFDAEEARWSAVRREDC